MSTIFVYVDFESTGLRVAQDDIIQVGATYTVDGTRVSFDELACPTVPLTDQICELTRLNRADVMAAAPLRDVLRAFSVFLLKVPGSARIGLVAYNGFKFDFPLLYHNCRRHRVSHPQSNSHGRVLAYYDPLLWIRGIAPSDGPPIPGALPKSLLPRGRGGVRPSYKLSDVYRTMFGTDFKNSHTALADAMAMARICEDPVDTTTPFEAGVLHYQLETAAFQRAMTQPAAKKKKKRAPGKSAPLPAVCPGDSSSVGGVLLQHVRSTTVPR